MTRFDTFEVRSGKAFVCTLPKSKVYFFKKKLSHICHSSTQKTVGVIGRWGDVVYGHTNNEDGNGSNDAHDNIF
jgi:hypothetical protein